MAVGRERRSRRWCSSDLNVTRADEIVSEIYEGAERRQLVATLGPLVAEAQAGGDAVAAEILKDAAAELVDAPRHR